MPAMVHVNFNITMSRSYTLGHTVIRLMLLYNNTIIIWSCERGPMGGAPYIRLNRGWASIQGINTVHLKTGHKNNTHARASPNNF